MSNEVDLSQKLFTKLVAVGKAIQTMDKTGTNSHFNFKFVEASHAYGKIRTELYNRGVFMVVSLGEVKQNGNLTHVEMTAAFIDSESGATLNIPWHGYGSDTQDKGLAKAITAGVKSLLLTTLLIPSGVEPDADSPVDNAPAKVEGLPLERLMALVTLAKDRGITDSKMKTKVNALGAKRAAEMTVVQADKLEKWINTQKVPVVTDG